MNSIKEEIEGLYYKIAILDRKYKKQFIKSIPSDFALNVNTIICMDEHLSSEFSFEDIYYAKLSSKSDFVLFYNFEILFRPEYRFDLMSFIKEKSKSRKFAIIWPGEVRDQQLIYSRPGRVDYYAHKIDNYLIYKEQ